MPVANEYIESLTYPYLISRLIDASYNSAVAYNNRGYLTEIEIIDQLTDEYIFHYLFNILSYELRQLGIVYIVDESEIRTYSHYCMTMIALRRIIDKESLLKTLMSLTDEKYDRLRALIEAQEFEEPEFLEQFVAYLVACELPTDENILLEEQIGTLAVGNDRFYDHVLAVLNVADVARTTTTADTLSAEEILKRIGIIKRSKERFRDALRHIDEKYAYHLSPSADSLLRLYYNTAINDKFTNGVDLTSGAHRTRMYHPAYYAGKNELDLASARMIVAFLFALTGEANMFTTLDNVAKEYNLGESAVNTLYGVWDIIASPGSRVDSSGGKL